MLPFSDNTLEALSWTLIHSLWQGALLGAFIHTWLNKIGPEKPGQKYNVLFGSLLAFFLMTIATFMYYCAAGSSDSGTISVISIQQIVWNSNEDFGHISRPALPLSYSLWISRFWVIGVLLFSIKFIFDFLQMTYLSYGNHRSENTYLSEIIGRIKTSMNITQEVSIYVSDKVISPMVSGWIKPMILFPMCLLNQLNNDELEAILAHELAHIKRRDWLSNLLKSIVQILFFYHPVVWWISSQLESERENSCDDLAVSYTRNQLNYVKVLLKMKEWQLAGPPMAIGFSGNKKSLLNRVKRILEQPQNPGNMKDKIIALTVLLCVMAGFAFTMAEKEKIDIPFLSKKEMKVDVDRELNIPHLTTTQKVQDTIPAKMQGKSKIAIMQNGKSIELEKENGEITSMKVDGEEVDPSEYDRYEEEFGQFEMDRNGDGFMFHFGDDEPMKMFGFGDKGAFRFGNEDFPFDSIPGMDWDNFNKHFEFAFPENMDSVFAFRFGDGNGFSFGNEEMIEKMQRMMEENFQHFDLPNGMMRNFDGMEFDFDDMGEWHGDGPFGGSKRGSISKKIGREMSADGLLKVGEENDIELTGKQLKINGEKQPDHLWKKYKDIWQDYSGIDLTQDSKIEFRVEGTKSRRKGLRRI